MNHADGLQDFVGVGWASGLEVYTNNGNGTFTRVFYTTNNIATTPQRLVKLVDVNSDSKLDILLNTWGSSSVSVYTNNGDGTYSGFVDYSATGNCYAFAVGDVTNDGYVDLITGSGSSAVSVFTNNGNGTFGSRVNYTVSSYSYGVAVADFNGDGKLDITSSNKSSNTISVLISNSTLTLVRSKLSVASASVTQAGYILQGATGQTADILRVQDSSGNSVIFGIAANGNVGIGTSNSAYKLDVNGSANVRGDLYINGVRRIDSIGNLYNINSIAPIGNVLFQNQVNSATSFQVQNSAANNMLSVDTVNRKITVGSAGASQLTNNGSTLNTAKALANYATGGSIGTAANTVDYYTTFTIPQTTASQTLTLPSPTVTTAGRIIYIINTGSTGFNIGTNYIANGSTATYIWNGTTWVASQAGLQGVTQVGTLDGQAKNANGATIAGTSIYMQTADATNPGLVSTTNQTFAGAKTFSSLLTASAGANISGAATNINVGSNFATNINTGGSTGAVTVGGNSVLFKNTANSTGAFVIQNSAGTALFTADTTGMKVTVTALTVSGDLTVNGHIITGGSTPTRASGAAACTTPTITVAGNDTAGTVSITTGSGCASTGVLTTITFASAFATTPRVSLSPTNSNAANLKYFNGTAGTASFTIDTGTVPTSSTLYTYSYFITQ